MKERGAALAISRFPLSKSPYWGTFLGPQEHPVPSGIPHEVIEIFKNKLSQAYIKFLMRCINLAGFTSKRRNPHCAWHTACSSHARFSTLDSLFSSEYLTIGITSPDLTTIQSPIVPLRRTCLPQGWTNTRAISHEHLTLLESEDPNVAWLAMENAAPRAPRYATNPTAAPQRFKTISESHSIRKFIWWHLEYILTVFTASSSDSMIPALWSPPRSNLWKSLRSSFSGRCNYEGRTRTTQ